MRDPARIPRIMKKLQALWEQYPDLRLGQLVNNVNVGNSTLFYLEDDNLEKQIDEGFGNAPTPTKD